VAVIVTFPRRVASARRAKDGASAARLRSALDGVGKTLAEPLLALLAELEDSSLRLSLIIERTAGEADRRTLRAEQQEIRATIADLKRAIGDEARAPAASDRGVLPVVGKNQLSARPPST
jgi:hypothetical protein